MKTLNDVSEVTQKPNDCFVTCKVTPDICGSFEVKFENKKSIFFQVDSDIEKEKSIFFQVDSDIDSMVEDMVLYEGQYYILDGYMHNAR